MNACVTVRSCCCWNVVSARVRECVSCWFFFTSLVYQHTFSKLELAVSFNYKLGCIPSMCAYSKWTKWHGHNAAVAAVYSDEHEQIENQCTICTTTENSRIEYQFVEQCEYIVNCTLYNRCRQSLDEQIIRLNKISTVSHINTITPT